MKGDGWAVKRYVCPVCKRKGLYVHHSRPTFLGTIYGNGFWCMYTKEWRKNRCNYDFNVTKEDVIKANPELKYIKPQWKAK